MSENYVPLYRKYRPQTLDTLVGQEHVKKTLTSAIELGKITHAYLFTGPRGTGKTSTARILAKSLNCVKGPTIHPCDECESCKDIINSVPIDVIEIDAASNRKVEDAQNILEKIQYAPVHGKYKIYIIDEVHMLSNTAFNALLKTLEEPPENVIFILATTEVHKVLDTIKSRCQRFDFRRITTEDIVKHLRYISEKENINISDDALFTIAKNSAGGMRDSISLLDQLSLLGASKQVTADDVNQILGRISFDVLNKLSEKIISSLPNEAIEVVNEVYNSGNEPLQILTNLSEYFKNLLIIKNCNKELLTELTGLNEQQISSIEKQKDSLEVHQIVFFIERISYYIKEIKLATNQYLWLEVCMIDLANMAENSKLLDLQNRIQALETGNVIPVNPVKKVIPAVNTKQKTDTKPDENPLSDKKQEKSVTPPQEDFTPPPMSKMPDKNDIETLWKTLLASIKNMPTKALLQQFATPVKISKEETIITFKNEQLINQFGMNNKKDYVVEAVNSMFSQKDSKITIRLAKPGDSAISTSQKAEQKEEVEKKNPEPIKIELPLEDEIDENIEKITAPPKNESEKLKDSEEKARLESDQEKMVLELFDGKYID